MEIQFPFSLVVFFSILLFFFFVIKLVHNVKRPKPLIKQKLPPEPWKLPLVGHMHHLAGSMPHRALRDLARKHGPIIHLRLGETSSVVISSPPLAKQVMKTHDLAFANRPELLSAQILLYDYKDIAFSPYGDYWRQMRKLCTLELLSAKKVKSYLPIREGESWNLVESIRSSLGTTINLSEKISKMMNVITSRAAFGDRCKDQELVIALIKESTSLSGGFDISDLFPSIKFLDVLTGLKPKILKIHKKIDHIFNTIISAHQERRARERSSSTMDREEEDLLDVLMRLKDDGGLEFPITSDHVKAIVMDMFAAGTDTSSVTIEWAMSELMRNPRVMEKAQAELRQAVKGKETVYESDIKELSYLKLVIKETMRLHPPLPLLLPRECRQQCEIRGYTIPVKTKVMVNVWTIGRDPDYWTDAESFIPERFNDSSNTIIGEEFEYLPFGAGRRMCPGASLGLASVELPLARLLYHFDWNLPYEGKSSGELDMSENFGSILKRKTDLLLVPTAYNTS